MRLDYKTGEIATIVGAELVGDSASLIQNVVYDSRKVVHGENSLFVCIKTKNQDGHHYISDAITKGVRIFLVADKKYVSSYEDYLVFLVAADPLIALQKLATFHRKKFDIPVFGITGSAGKTIVKEWLSIYLSSKYKVTKSPKSFNSQLGVAISLLEIDTESEIALIEAGISEPGEMEILQRMIQPTHGILTALGQNHRENFRDLEHIFCEKNVLFKEVKFIYINEKLKEYYPSNEKVFLSTSEFDTPSSFTGIDQINLGLCERIAFDFGISQAECQTIRKSLKHIHLRLETIEGVNDSKLILDAYNRTIDGLEQALAYQVAISDNYSRILIVQNNDLEVINTDELNLLLNRYQLKIQPDLLQGFTVFSKHQLVSLPAAKQLILLKGNHSETLRLGNQWKKRKHQTFVEISLDAVAHNLKMWKKSIAEHTAILAMVKASSYGTEIGEMGKFLEQQKVGYIGVAFTDEGVLLRKQGVALPILVMNSDRSSWEDCIQYKLEPSLFSLTILDDFLSFVRDQELKGVSVHLKLDTGMNRLGITECEMDALVDTLRNTSELIIKSVFSHLADADNEDVRFTNEQVERFEKGVHQIEKSLNITVLKHLLNSDGAALGKLPSYDMIRLGIGLYGVSSHAKMCSTLLPVIQWKSVVSQIKRIAKGQTIGYSRTYLAEKDELIAVIPVGYADGFKRSLSQGKGGVYIQGAFCPVLGNVCMDMIMVRVDDSIKVGDVVEILGKNQSIQNFAQNAGTIPYEIMTGLSSRMPRVFVQSED